MGAILKELHNSASKFQFPSMPKDDVDVKRETAYQEYNILGKGKMSYPSGMGTQIIKWSGYFWGAGRKKLASVNQKWIAPKTCASKLKSWQTKKTPLNLVVSEAGINEDVTIKSFEYKPFGGHGDYSYEISFVPYVEMKIYTTKELGTKKKAKKKKKTTRPSTKKSPMWDLEKGDFVRTAANNVPMNDGYEAYKIWCVKTVSTERYSCLGYSDDHGTETEDITRESDQSTVELSLERTIQEALMVNPRTSSVEEFSFEWGTGRVKVSFIVYSVDGEPFTVDSIIEV